MSQCTIAVHPQCGFCNKLKDENSGCSLVTGGACTFLDCSKNPENELCRVQGYPFTHLPDGKSIPGYTPDWEKRVTEALGRIEHDVKEIEHDILDLQSVSSSM
jgi:hypothetical protein